VQASEEYFAPHTFQTEGAARVWLETERRLIEADRWTPPAERVEAMRRAEEDRRNAPTIREFATAYIERKKLSATSRERYGQLLRFYILAEPVPSKKKGVRAKKIAKAGLGDVLVQELTRSQVRAWWNGLPVEKRESSCSQAYDLLRAVMNAAVDEEMIDVNPVRVKGASKPSKERDLDPLPVPTLYAIADAMPEQYRLGVLIGGVLGLRSGEVRALSRADVDVKDALLKVERSVKEAERTMTIGPTKTEKSRRTVPIPKALLPDFREHLRDHVMWGKDTLLFPRSDGGPVRSAAWLKMFKKACQQVAAQETDEHIKALLTDHGGYIFHGARATGLTMAYRASGGNLKAVERLAGHTSAKTAMRYQRAELGYLVDVAENISEMIEQGREASS
jgi:integrase